MKPEQFCYWLQGFFEITENSDNKEIALSKKQIEVIRSHLNLVFFHVIDNENMVGMSALEKLKYSKIHSGSKSGEHITEKEFKELVERSSEEIKKESILRDFPKAHYDSEIRFNC